MKQTLKSSLAIAIASCAGFASAQQTTFACQFGHAAGMTWQGGAWRTATFASNKDQFSIRIQDGKLDSKSVAQFLGDWGGMNATCLSIPTIPNDTESFHFRCTMNATSSKMLIFNPFTGKGALVSPTAAIYSDTKKAKDDIGIETFNCRQQ